MRNKILLPVFFLHLRSVIFPPLHFSALDIQCLFICLRNSNVNARGTRAWVFVPSSIANTCNNPWHTFNGGMNESSNSERDDQTEQFPFAGFCWSVAEGPTTGSMSQLARTTLSCHLHCFKKCRATVGQHSKAPWIFTNNIPRLIFKMNNMKPREAKEQIPGYRRPISSAIKSRTQAQEIFHLISLKPPQIRKVTMEC